MAGVSAVGAAAHVGPMIAGRAEIPAAVATPGQRALVPLQTAAPGASDGTPVRLARATPDAPFLTHLIATAQGVPQSRERRRAEPKWATSAYAAAMQAPDAVIPAVSATR